MLGSPEISIVIPVYNEEESLPQLFKELYPVMENLQRSFEIIFINDGSRDKSFAMLYDFQKEHEKTVRVIDLNGNKDMHYSLSGGFLDQDGVGIGSGFTRASFLVGVHLMDADGR